MRPGKWPASRTRWTFSALRRRSPATEGVAVPRRTWPAVANWPRARCAGWLTLPFASGCPSSALTVLAVAISRTATSVLIDACFMVGQRGAGMSATRHRQIGELHEALSIAQVNRNPPKCRIARQDRLVVCPCAANGAPARAQSSRRLARSCGSSSTVPTEARHRKLERRFTRRSCATRHRRSHSAWAKIADSIQRIGERQERSAFNCTPDVDAGPSCDRIG